jgi:hypothetical protein
MRGMGKEKKGEGEGKIEKKQGAGQEQKTEVRDQKLDDVKIDHRKYSRYCSVSVLACEWDR